MPSLKHFVLLFTFYGVIESKQFRYNYTFYPSIDGYLKLHILPAIWQDARLICGIDEGTLRVTFVVHVPYHVYNRDSPQFQNNSKALTEAVNSVFRDLPGTYRANLVEIQPRPADDFSCEATLDIIVSGNHLNKISETLLDHIRNKKMLGNVVVDDDDYNATVIGSEGILASPSNDNMKKAMDSEIEKSTILRGIYTGVSAIYSEGYFSSIEGVPLDDMPLQWMPGEPNNVDDDENCIAYENGRVADVKCTQLLPFICYKKGKEIAN